MPRRCQRHQAAPGVVGAGGALGPPPGADPFERGERGLDRQVLEGLANRESFAELIHRMGVRVSDKQIADQIKQMFRLFRRKYGLDRPLPAQDCTLFRPPLPQSGHQ